MRVLFFLIITIFSTNLYSAQSCSEVVARFDYETKNYNKVMHGLNFSELSKAEKNNLMHELYPIRGELLSLSEGSAMDDCMTFQQSVDWGKLVQNVNTSISRLRRFLSN